MVTGDLKYSYLLQRVGTARIVSPTKFPTILQSEGEATP